MSTMVKEIYAALKSAGAEEKLAIAAAEVVPSAEDLATKADIAELLIALGALKADIYRQLWLMGISLLGAMVALKLFA